MSWNLVQDLSAKRASLNRGRGKELSDHQKALMMALISDELEDSWRMQVRTLLGR